MENMKKLHKKELDEKNLLGRNQKFNKPGAVEISLQNAGIINVKMPCDMQVGPGVPNARCYEERSRYLYWQVRMSLKFTF